MLGKILTLQVEQTAKFFRTTTSIFEPDDAGFAPDPEMFTVAGQIAHTGLTLDWFMAGAFGPGWDMDFEADVARAKAITSLEAARQAFEGGIANAIRTIGAASDADLMAPIPNDVVMDGAPRQAIVGAIVDHCAHHRGALAVYARLLGKVPPMPYG
jgi:uncharacterized damage-inducible protein DinB